MYLKSWQFHKNAWKRSPSISLRHKGPQSRQSTWWGEVLINFLELLNSCPSASKNTSQARWNAARMERLGVKFSGCKKRTAIGFGLAGWGGGGAIRLEMEMYIYIIKGYRVDTDTIRRKIWKVPNTATQMDKANTRDSIYGRTTIENYRAESFNTYRNKQLLYTIAHVAASNLHIAKKDTKLPIFNNHQFHKHTPVIYWSSHVANSVNFHSPWKAPSIVKHTTNDQSTLNCSLHHILL